MSIVETVRSDAWIAGVSHGAAADTSYQGALQRMSEAAGMMNRRLALWHDARDAFAATPSEANRLSADEAWEAYMGAKRTYESAGSTVSQMQDMYVAGIERDFTEQADPVLTQLIDNIKAADTRIERLSNERNNKAGMLQIAMEKRESVSERRVGVIPANIDDWKSYSEAFVASAASLEDLKGVDAAIDQLTYAVDIIDGELSRLRMVRDNMCAQYNAAVGNTEQFTMLTIRHMPVTPVEDKVLVSGLETSIEDVLQLPSLDDAIEKILDFAPAVADEDSVIVSDTGREIDEMTEDLGFIKELPVESFDNISADLDVTRQIDEAQKRAEAAEKFLANFEKMEL